MHTELYCTRLTSLDPIKAIRAIHQAHLQLVATMPAALAEGYDNAPALAALFECLKDAGHIGYDLKAGRVNE